MSTIDSCENTIYTSLLRKQVGIFFDLTPWKKNNLFWKRLEFIQLTNSTTLIITKIVTCKGK